MPVATFDTNIYISALVFGAPPRRLLDLAIDGEIDVAISEPILDETLRVLGDKFSWSPQRLAAAKELIVSFAQVFVPSVTVHVIHEDPSDNRILECAVESESEYVLTGDKDLHRLGNYGGSRVVTAAAMLEILQRNIRHGSAG